jgi:FkbM family methyltransferase
MNGLRNKLKTYGPRTFLLFAFIEIKNKISMQIIRNSYSQKGEDLVIERLLHNPKSGFYVDVGAHDPDRFSNTKRFYKKGWSGINIEPDKNSYNKFLAKRSRDINLNMGIGNKASNQTFYKFIPSALSTFSKKTALSYENQGYKLVKKSKNKISTLSNIFSQYLDGKNIDFMSIDVEGLDLQVLKGNNWSKFKPKLICIESVDHDISGENKKKRNDISTFLYKKGYEKKFDNNLNSIYVLKGNISSAK